MDRYSKVKLFRTLKVVFYCLGLPLFFLCTLSIAMMMFLNRFPFVAQVDSQMFAAIAVPFNSPALYGVWVALGVWIVLAAVQLILHFTVKGRKTRMFAMVSATLVIMLIPVFVIDSVFSKKIETIAASAPAGVTVNSYEYELGHYRTMSSDGGSATGRIGNETDKLVNAVNHFTQVYHIGYYGAQKDGTAGNTTNVPVTYKDLGVTKLDQYGNDISDQIVQDAPTGAKIKKGLAVEGTGYLEIDGKRFDDYFFIARQPNDKPKYLWYSKSKMPEYRDGVYGLASYNRNGRLSDGYIYSTAVALEILEDYYEAQDEINAIIAKAGGKVSVFTGKTVEGSIDEEKLEATDLTTARDAYKKRGINYMMEFYGSGENKELFDSEMAKAPGFTLTEQELDVLVSLLGGAIGGNALIDKLFDLLGSETGGGGILETLKNGATVGNILDSLSGLVGSLAPGTPDRAKIDGILDMLGLTNTKIFVIREKNEDGSGKALTIKLEQAKNPDGSDMDGLFKDRPCAISLGPDLSLNSIDDLLDALIMGLGDALLGAGGGNTLKRLVPTILDMVGVSIPMVTDALGYQKLSVKAFLLDMVGSLYWYASPLILPEYEFYTYNMTSEDTNDYKLGAAVAKYERALYEGSKHGFFIGSTLIDGGGLLGGGIGDGSYQSSNGYKSLAQVHQLKTDLSYKITLYPLLSVRDMLMVFAGIVILFTILSYYASEKEIEWATGKAAVKVKAGKRSKKVKKGAKGADTAHEIAPLEDTALKASENKDKEVF